MNIHVAGDSHTLTYTNVPSMLVHHLGATTAYNLEKHTGELFQLMVNHRADFFWLSYGEIDCRVWIHTKMVEKGWDTDFAVEYQQAPFRKTIEEIAKEGYKVGVLAVPPAGPCPPGPGIPHYPVRGLRQLITDKWNNLLRQWDAVPVLQAWPNAIELNPDLYPDGSHLDADVVSVMFVQALHTKL